MTQPDNAAFAQSQEQKQASQSLYHLSKLQLYDSHSSNLQKNKSFQASQRFEQAYQT